MAEVAELRLLVPGDEARLFAFLDRYADTSLFFLSNVQRAGLEDRGEALQATYVASVDAAGAITALAGHAWNGNVMLQGDAGLEQAVLRAVALSDRAVRGLIGSWSLVERARRALGLANAPATHDGRELLFALELERLLLPNLLSRSDVVLRSPTLAEADAVLVNWRVDYRVECLGAARTPGLHDAAFHEVRAWRSNDMLWVLAVGSDLVAMTGFNAEANGVVQVGGVFTPAELRGRGYARAAVAASLLVAQGRGARRSVLFTAETNYAAQRAYTSLGYRVSGDYGLVLF